ncbi:carboxylesterase family protein [Leuconostoc citreum]|uniref:carboxylesterase family protein n=1 Tax=Leuconostoc citreum TaxID=33964 RepID=UPI003C49240A
MADEATVVTISQGQLLGTKEGQTSAFYDVPYGSNQGRFKHVGTPISWTGVRDARQPGVIFKQGPNRLASVMGSKPGEKNQSEDAFRLNVWTPDVRGKKPVLFWIHGGGFLTGGGALSWYDARHLAENGDVVVVTVNYRLGVFGNLRLPGISDGNLALNDLITALKWVKRHISAFGGDPEQVTVAGQSAGAWYSLALLASDESYQLFNRLGLMSFPGSVEALSEENAQLLASLLLSHFNLSSKQASKLLDVADDELIAAQGAVTLAMQKRTHDYVPTGFIPMIDGKLLKGDIISEAVRHAQGHVAIFGGTTTHETTSFFHQTPQSKKADYLDFIATSTTTIFTEPTSRLFKAMADRHNDVFQYVMAYPAADPNILACHCIELPFIFDNFEMWDNAPMLAGMDQLSAQQLAHQMQSYFYQFIKYGNPNVAPNLTWPKLTSNDSETMVFNKTSSIQRIVE